MVSLSAACRLLQNDPDIAALFPRAERVLCRDVDVASLCASKSSSDECQASPVCTPQFGSSCKMCRDHIYRRCAPKLPHRLAAAVVNYPICAATGGADPSRPHECKCPYHPPTSGTDEQKALAASGAQQIFVQGQGCRTVDDVCTAAEGSWQRVRGSSGRKYQCIGPDATELRIRDALGDIWYSTYDAEGYSAWRLGQ